MRRFLALALAVGLGATWAMAQRRGVVAGPSGGGFRGGATSPPTQIVRPNPGIGNFPSANRTFGTYRYGGGFRNRNSSGLSQYFSRTFAPNYFNPLYNNFYYGCTNPFAGYSPYCAQYLPYGQYSFGAYPYPGFYPYASAYPFAGYYGGPYGIAAAGDGQNENQQAGSEQQERVWVQGNPPRADALDEASAFHRVAPRDVLLELDGAAISVPEDGRPLTVGSGNHTLRLTAQSTPGTETVPPTPHQKNPTP